MALPYTETWTGTNGDPWSGDWTTSGSTAAAATIQGNRGHFYAGTLSGYNGYNRALLADQGAADFDETVDFQAAFQAEQYATVLFRTDRTWLATFGNVAYPTNGYGVEIKVDGTAGNGWWFVDQVDAGVRGGEQVTPTAFSVAVADVIHINVKAVGTAVEVRIWKNSDPKPTDPTYSFTDTAHTARTGHGLALLGGGGSGYEVYWDNLSIVAPTASPQLLEPISDIATNSWVDQAGGTTSLYATMDEGTASDTDYAASPLAAASSSYLEVELDAGTDPLSSTDHKVRYRYGKVAGAGTTDLTVSLRQGASQIASWAHTNIAGGWTTAEQTLTGGEADAITDYADLRLRFAPTGAAAVTPSKVADRASAAHTTSVDPYTLALSAGTTVGNYLIARVAPNNSGSGGARPGLTVSDPRGNTWTVTTGALQDPGAINTGAAEYIAYCLITTAHQTGDLVSFDWGASPAVKSVVIEEWTGIDPTTPVAVAAVQANGNTSPISVARTPTAANQLVYAAAGLEGPQADTAPGAVTGWTALTRIGSALATAADNMTVVGAYRLATGAVAHTWNPTLTTARDWAAEAIVFAQDLGSRARVSWAQVELPAVPAADYLDLELGPAGLGLHVLEVSTSVVRALTPTATGLGLQALEVSTSVVRALTPMATGLGLQALEVDGILGVQLGGLLLRYGTADHLLTQSGDRLAYLGELGPEVDLTLAAAGLGLGTATVALGVVRGLEVLPAGLGLEVPPASLGVVRELEPVAAGLGFDVLPAALGVVRELEPVAAGLGLDALSAALGVVRTLAPSASGVGLDALALTALGVVRSLTPVASGLGLEATSATLAAIRFLTLGATGLGLSTTLSSVEVGAGIVLDVAPAGLGLGVSGLVLGLPLPLELAPAGLGLEAATMALGVVRSLTVAATGVGLEGAMVALSAVRQLTPVAASLGLEAATVAVRLTISLTPTPAGVGLHASEVDALLEDITLVLLLPDRGTVGLGSSDGTVTLLQGLTPAPAGMGLGSIAAPLGVAKGLVLGPAGLGLGAGAVPLGHLVPLELMAAALGLGALPAVLRLMAVTVPPSWGSSVVLLNPTPTDVEDMPGATRVLVGGSPTSVVP